MTSTLSSPPFTSYQVPSSLLLPVPPILQLMSSSSPIIIVTCICNIICVCLCMCTQIHKYNLPSLFVVGMHIVSRLTILYWTTN